LLNSRKKVDALQWGAAQPHVYAKDINKLPLAVAPLDLLSKFEEQIIEMFDQIEILEKENIRLTILRDTLLPKLMSGQIKL
jgi:type I restriction enzyme S subunit